MRIFNFLTQDDVDNPTRLTLVPLRRMILISNPA